MLFHSFSFCHLKIALKNVFFTSPSVGLTFQGRIQPFSSKATQNCFLVTVLGDLDIQSVY